MGVLPLLGLEVAVIGAFDLTCLHENLRRRAVDAFLEACGGEPPSFPDGRWAALPVQDMAADFLFAAGYREVRVVHCNGVPAIDGWWSCMWRRRRGYGAADCSWMVADEWCWRAAVPQ